MAATMKSWASSFLALRSDQQWGMSRSHVLPMIPKICDYLEDPHEYFVGVLLVLKV